MIGALLAVILLAPPQAAAPGAGSGAQPPFRAAADVALFHLKKTVLPDVPAGTNLRSKVNVVFLIAISPEGRVVETRLITKPGPLADAALEAAKQWQFEPFELNGKRVRSNVISQVGITFENKDGKPVSELLFPFGDFSDEPDYEGQGEGSNPPVHDRERRMELDKRLMQGKLISAPRPVYPQNEKMMGASATVVLTGIIGKDGHIKALRCIKTRSTAFTIASIESVKQWQYAPYMLNGSPVEVETQIEVNFTITRGR